MLTKRNGVYKEIPWHGLNTRQLFEIQAADTEKPTKAEVLDAMIKAVSFGTDQSIEEAKQLSEEADWETFSELASLIMGKSIIEAKAAKN